MRGARSSPSGARMARRWCSPTSTRRERRSCERGFVEISKEIGLILETATRTLLKPFDLEAGQLERVFGVLGARKIDLADLYFQYSRFEGWSLEEGIVKSGSFNIEQGVGVRAVAGEKTAFAYSDEISFNALQDAARTTRAIAAAGQVRRVKAGAADMPAPLYREVDPVASLESSQKVSLLE